MDLKTRIERIIADPDNRFWIIPEFLRPIIAYRMLATGESFADAYNEVLNVARDLMKP